MIPLLRLYLSPLDATHFKAIVTDSPAGQKEADSRLPFWDEEHIDRRITILKALDATSFRPQDFRDEGEQAWMVRTGLLSQDRSAFLPDMREQIGRELYHAAFPEGSGVRELLHKSIAIVQATNTFPFLHVQIKIEADVARQGRARVADYPWELICDEQGFFAHQVVFSRYIAYDGVVPHLSPVEKTTIVCISSAAFDPAQKLSPLSSQERQAIRDGLDKADPSRLHVDVLTPATVGRLRAYLTEQRDEAAPSVLHFDGHGFFGKRCTHVLPNNKACGMMHSGRAATACTTCGAPLPADPQGFLLFEGETNTSPQYVSAQELGDLLQATKVALVVLSACRSGFSQGSETVWNGVAQGLIGRRVPAVVAMQSQISVSAAAQFAEQFYRSLGQHLPLVQAVDSGRKAIGLDGHEWYRPVLYLRWQDNEGGQLFAAQTRIQPGRSRLFQAPDLPKSYVPRPKAFEKIKHQLLEQHSGQTTAITTALRGAGGFGKTTLALALCHDPEIQAVFPDGILWIVLGEHPPSPLDVLNGVLASLETPYREAIGLVEARERWRAALDGRVYLLVIDDVWQKAALEPLLEGGPLCVRLITTRNDQVLSEETARVLVDEMEPEEAIAVLRRGLPDEIQQAAYQPRLEALAKRLGYWPLLLTLAQGTLTSFVKHSQTIEKALTNVEKAYQTRGVTAFHRENADERQQRADACLEVSLHHLKEITPPHYDAIARYHELAVFPEDTDIPLTTLQTYWQGTSGLEDWEAEDLCVWLDDLSLLLPTDLGKGTIRLHDVFHSYLIQRAGTNLPALHARLLDSYQQVLGLTHWANLPQSKAYLWQHLILHLFQAKCQEALQTTLTDLSYLTRKVLYVGVSALEADLLLASTCFPEPALSFFLSLHHTLVRISHLLRQVHTPAEMGGLLLSHLGSQPSFAAQRAVFERELLRPFLTAWHPLPSGASSALLRTLHGHTDTVSSCAVSPDGRWIVSASHDHTLKVWDAATGAQRLSLSNHTLPVYGCAVSPDGSFIVSASHDETLKVWDAATGAQRLSLIGHTSGVRSCVVSPDGGFIISASEDHTLKVWDAATGAERLSLIGHTSWVRGCAVSPNGDVIISASKDHTLKVWDMQTGHCILTFPMDGGLFDCVFHPDGEHLVACGAQGVYFLRLVV